MKQLWFDSETFSSVPLARGHHAYFASPDAQIMVAQWAVDGGPVHVEDLTDVHEDGTVTCRMPSEALIEALLFADEVVIHNSAFDRAAIRRCWGIELEVERTHDTMARAMAHSLPGALEKLGVIMGLGADEQKAKGGKKLIDLFCKPRPKKHKLRRATKETHPQEWEEFLQYAHDDIPPMRVLYKKLPSWNYTGRERQLWELDQRSNERGFRVDLDLAHKAIETIRRVQAGLDDETKALTNGEVEKATKRDDLMNHIFVEFGVYLPDLKKDTLERLLQDDDLEDGLKQLIRVRLAKTTSSTAKFNALERSAVEESPGVYVLRGTTAFCGALRTGRWAGRIFQPQNLPRPSFKLKKIEQAIEAIKADALDLVSHQPMKEMSEVLRGAIIARPGCHIFASDLSNIEGRVASWLAGERWKLKAFREIDEAKARGDKVADMYQRAYAAMFGVPEELMALILGDDRQVGKVSELANGYEGGVGAALAFAAVYRLDLDAIAEKAWPNLPEGARTQAGIMWDWRRKKNLSTFGLERRTFIVFEAFKILWREAHPEISTMWDELGEGAMEAIRHPKYEVECRKLVFEKRGTWLRMILPSGRVLCYPAPRIEEVRGRSGEAVTFAGVNQYGGRKWGRTNTYGGKLFENACQAVARDVMGHAMPEIEDMGFKVLLTVHDEVITEGRIKSNLTSSALSATLAKNPPWMKGCPLAASGFEADRYRKDD